MKLDCGHHRVGIATADVDGGLGCGHQRVDVGAIDDPEVVELCMHLAGNGFKVVQLRRSKTKMRSRAATVGRNEALSTITDMKLQEFTARTMYITACAARRPADAQHDMPHPSGGGVSPNPDGRATCKELD